jgi:hypothetical protein
LTPHGIANQLKIGESSSSVRKLELASEVHLGDFAQPPDWINSTVRKFFGSALVRVLDVGF